MKITHSIKTVAIAAVLAGAFGPVAAHSAEEKEKRFAESQYRHDVMEHFSYGFKKITAIMKGQAGEKAHIPAIAAIMAEAATMAKDSFAKDTRGMAGRTEAKDKIWDNWQDYASRMDKLVVDTAAFAAAAKGGDMAAMGPAMKKVGGSCKSCHDEYKD
ncbi:MAG: cytochrome c [Kordiimonadaceae bacterium]|nr:cytochrome c [Kordiimonadaceae bacterium]